MKFTIDWLKNYVDLDGLLPEELTDKLTMLGLEVEGMTTLFEELADVKVARILEAVPHPNADTLQLCKVAVGDEQYEIVCGAPNARAGLLTPVALSGTVLPGNFKIKKSKVRGVVSNGMLCSEKELGLSEESDGIMELPENLQHGDSFIHAMGLSDIQIEVDLTPNRADCASVIGIAREVAGFRGTALKLPLENGAISRQSEEFSVEIEAPDLCPRYAGRLIRNVTIGPSPWWLQRRLISIGLRPINNVVDVTNFVMMEYGQPLHAFDFDTLEGGKIIVRTPRSDELNFVTLDEKERKLDPEMLMICDAKHPVAVAGIMGGMNSEVSETTTNILLESACFNDISIRRTARKLNLASDASYRFERGVDPEGTINAMNRAVQLLLELAGGSCPESEGIDAYPGRKPAKTLALHIQRCNELNGIELSRAQIASMLESIGIHCENPDEETLLVTPPSFRVDIERQADLVEEVARLYGYDRIPVSLPTVNLSYPEQDPARLLRLETSDIFARLGFSEAINYSFSSSDHLDMMNLTADDPRRKQVELLNPLNEEQSAMRTMLIPGLLENVGRNIRFQKTSLKLFEIGKVFTPTEENLQPVENTRLAGVLSGNIYGEFDPLYHKQRNVDIFDAKGCIEYLLQALRLNTTAADNIVSFEILQEKEPFVESGRHLSLFSDKKVIGSLGKLSDDVVKSFGIKQQVYFFDIDFDILCSLTALPKSFSPLPVYPSVKRDIALVVADNVSAGELLQSVRESREKLIEHSEIFDIFKGGKIPEGYKSVALSITYRSPSKTLTEKNVEKAHSKIVKTLTDTFGGQFREA
ncbi:phenylalanine--tRNA ligase subunit beta [Desulfopila inferna]|uniref:phenylalanine--tRNA ligase subunit beta n=1 Tax=Desulfopila inferna TaxID=468528 RepID=UPI0019658B47|nr:phenylalanine--tRNA ligase subunit beta [Desulfopila inferna]MBM9605985.1 phenylalanine--tRNA ligase subunit beta [Desulfopila inferna]